MVVRHFQPCESGQRSQPGSEAYLSRSPIAIIHAMIGAFGPFSGDNHGHGVALGRSGVRKLASSSRWVRQYLLRSGLSGLPRDDDRLFLNGARADSIGRLS